MVNKLILLMCLFIVGCSNRPFTKQPDGIVDQSADKAIIKADNSLEIAQQTQQAFNNFRDNSLMFVIIALIIVTGIVVIVWILNVLKMPAKAAKLYTLGRQQRIEREQRMK